MRYLPFIIISFVLYALFFYNNQQPELLTATSEADSVEKVVPLDFSKVIEQGKQTTASVPNHTDNTQAQPVVLTPPVTPEPKKPIEKMQTKINLQTLKASIKRVPASEGALLKGEFYERDFHLDLPAPPKQIKAPKKIKPNAKKITKTEKVTIKSIANSKQGSVTSELLKMQQTSNAVAPKKNSSRNE